MRRWPTVREQYATYNAVDDRPLGDGDFAQVSLDGVPRMAKANRSHGRNDGRDRWQQYDARVQRPSAGRISRR